MKILMHRTSKMLSKKAVVIYVLCAATLLIFLAAALTRDSQPIKTEQGQLSPETHKTSDTINATNEPIKNEGAQSNDSTKEASTTTRSNQAQQQAVEYQKSADQAAASAAELRRCNSLNTAAYSTYQSRRDGASSTLYNYQIPQLTARRDQGSITIAEFDEGMRQAYAQYNNAVSSAFADYSNSLTSQSCDPHVTVAPSPLTWEF